MTGPIRGSRHVAKILSFLDEIKPLFDKIGDLAKKLRQSIEEVGERIMDNANRIVRSSRYWRRRLNDLATQGHGPQRHEGDVTDLQLLNRSLHGFDPMTNSPVDAPRFRKKYGVDYDPVVHGTPPNFGGRTISVPGKGDLPIVMGSKIRHVVGDHATKFNTPIDYVRSHDAVRRDLRFKAFESDPNNNYFSVDNIRLDAVFDWPFAQRLKGYDMNGNPTVFGPDTTIFASFTKDANGIPQLVTLYVEPK